MVNIPGRLPPPRPRNTAAVVGRPVRKGMPVVGGDILNGRVTPDTPLGTPLLPGAKPQVSAVPEDTPDLPDGMKLGLDGIKMWTSLTRKLKKRGTWTDDYKASLYTLCTLFEVANELKETFLAEMVVNIKGVDKLNPAITEWSKVVSVLKSYYAEFELTPKSSGIEPQKKNQPGAVVSRATSAAVPQVPLPEFVEDDQEAE